MTLPPALICPNPAVCTYPKCKPWKLMSGRLPWKHFPIQILNRHWAFASGCFSMGNRPEKNYISLWYSPQILCGVIGSVRDWMYFSKPVMCMMQTLNIVRNIQTLIIFGITQMVKWFARWYSSNVTFPAHFRGLILVQICSIKRSMKYFAHYHQLSHYLNQNS